MSDVTELVRRARQIAQSKVDVFPEDAGVIYELADMVDGTTYDDLLWSSDEMARREREAVRLLHEAQAEVKRLNEWINTYAYDKAGFKL